MICRVSKWLAEMITQNRCGIAVEPYVPNAFALVLEKMADNPELAKEMGLNARHFAEREFGREQLGNRFVDFLERMVGA